MINYQFRLGLEFVWNLTLTDYIDDVSFTYADPSGLGRHWTDLEPPSSSPALAESAGVEDADAFLNNFRWDASFESPRGNPDKNDTYGTLQLTLSKVVMGSSNFRKNNNYNKRRTVNRKPTHQAASLAAAAWDAAAPSSELSESPSLQQFLCRLDEHEARLGASLSSSGMVVGCSFGPMHTNALSNSTSPYLRQHQHNPVEWMPWGEDAWAKARAENKLVIVSVGYSACHWCHVMEHETFENDEAAAFMNAHFVSIKVDREERPDVDQVYMDAVQLMTRRGGWPLNCVALPDGRPIWGGTYFPTERWLAGLGAVRDVWQEDADKVEAYAEQLATAVGAMDDGVVAMPASADDGLAKQVDRQLVEGLSRWQTTWDMTHGGSQGAPKFPLPCQVSFWLRLAQAKGPEWTSGWSSAGQDHALRTLGGHGTRWHPRPRGWRVCSVQRGRPLARAAFREDAVRQRPTPRSFGRGNEPV